MEAERSCGENGVAMRQSEDGPLGWICQPGMLGSNASQPICFLPLLGRRFLCHGVRRRSAAGLERSPIT
jgi:hypothetical protein